MKDYRDRATGLADLLNYAAMVNDGIMLLKEGSLCAGWQYSGFDIYSLQESQLINLRLTINQAFGHLGNGWMLHADMIRRQANRYIAEESNHFPDPTSFFIDQERRNHFLKEDTHFVSEYIFILTYKPPLEIESKLKKFFIVENEQSVGWEEVLINFENKLKQIENSLSKILTLKRLLTGDLLTHLHKTITGLDHPIKFPQFFVYLDQLLASKDFVGGFCPKTGQKHMIVLGVNGFPLESFPNMLQYLSELPISFRWSNRFIFLDTLLSVQEIKKHRRYWFQKKQGIVGLLKDIFNAEASSFLDQDALEMANDADNAIQEAESNLVHHGYYTSTFILLDENVSKLTFASKLLAKELEKKGFAARVETINAVEAYLGSLPGHGYQNIRRPLVSTYNLADFLPLLSIWDGVDYHPSPYYFPQSPPLFYAQTQGKTPFRCSLHVEDVGHTLVVGDTGNGKSTLLGFIMAQHLRYQHAQIFMFDKGYSSFTLCHALGGQHYDIASDKASLSFSPLQEINNELELDWACEWLEGVYQSQGIALTPLQRKEIRDSLLRLKNQPFKTLTDLQVSLQDHVLKSALEFYTLSGAMGQLLDSNQDDISSSHFQVFEMQHLLNREEKFVLPVLDYLFHQINKRLDVKKPSLILIEEGHRFIKGHFGKQLETWLRECRKQNAAVIFVTQGLSEIVCSNYQHILFNSCQTKIFLPHVNATASFNKSLYQQVGLSDDQINIIQQAIPKQDYYLTNSNGSRLMDLALSKTFLALMDATNIQSREQILQLKEKHQEQWIYHYLLDKGLAKEAQDWMQGFNGKQYLRQV